MLIIGREDINRKKMHTPYLSYMYEAKECIRVIVQSYHVSEFCPLSRIETRERTKRRTTVLYVGTSCVCGPPMQLKKGSYKVSETWCCVE
jgi:hypothetical protein